MADEAPDYDDPGVEEAWCDERLAEVAEYLEEQGIAHGEIGDWPAWHVAPYVSIWAVESATRPGWVGHWVICGDLPTDHVAKADAADPREAVRVIAGRWTDAAGFMANGEVHPQFGIGSSAEERRKLAPMLASRAALLARWADDDEIWDDEEGEPA